VSLKLENISVDNENEVILKDISYEFQPGKIYVLIGRTRSGKTSMMRLVSGLLASDEGSILFRDKDFDGVPIWDRNISMVYQQFINYPNRTVLQNVEFPLLRAGISKADAKARALAMIEKVGLTSFLDRKPGQLSGGQQQRVAIARALVRNADIVLLDEPLMNLDFKLREQLREEFRELFTSAKEAVTIYATTEPAEALILGDELLVLHEGRIIQFGKPADVYENPANVDVARIINDPPMTILNAKIQDGQIIVGGNIKFKSPKHLGDQSNGDYQIGVRANEIVMNGKGDLELEGTITLVEVSGSETLIYADTNAGEVIIQQEGIHNLEIGQKVLAAIDPKRIFLFDGSGSLSSAPGN
jgi:glycerol transport system ATP-binding protein